MFMTESLHQNVSGRERVITAIAGAGLFLLAARLPRLRGTLKAVSTALFMRGVTGYCPAYAAAGVNGQGDERESSRPGRRAGSMMSDAPGFQDRYAFDME